MERKQLRIFFPRSNMKHHDDVAWSKISSLLLTFFQLFFFFSLCVKCCFDSQKKGRKPFAWSNDGAHYCLTICSQEPKNRPLCTVTSRCGLTCEEHVYVEDSSHPRGLGVRQRNALRPPPPLPPPDKSMHFCTCTYRYEHDVYTHAAVLTKTENIQRPRLISLHNESLLRN